MKQIRNAAKRILVFALVLSLTFESVAVTPTKAIGLDALSVIADGAQVIGMALNIGSTLANGDWSDPGTIGLQLVDSVFGTHFGPDPKQQALDEIYGDVKNIKNSVDGLNKSVDYLVKNSELINSKLDTIGTKLDTMDHKLDKQTQMITVLQESMDSMHEDMKESFTDLKALINYNTDQIKVTTYTSTVQIEKSGELNNQLTAFVNKYSNLYTTENNILKSLATKQDLYTTFYNEIQKLDDKDRIMAALNELGAGDAKAEKLTAEQRKLLTDTYVTVGGKKYQVLKFHQDFVTDLMEFASGTGSNPSSSIYTLNNSVAVGGNVGEIVLSMGDYLLGKNETFTSLTGERGIGELYYLYCTYTCHNSDEVHQKYKTFMDSMVMQYMATAYLAEIAYGYRIQNEAFGRNNTATIRDYEQYLYDVNAQMQQIAAYYDYEYHKCVNTYDFGEYPISGDQNEYLVWYGNADNGFKWSIERKTESESTLPAALSDSDVRLALGEQYQLHYYFNSSDVSGRKNTGWESSDPSVCVVDSDGTILALSRGTAVISAQYKDNVQQKKTCLVTIGDCMAVRNDTGKSSYSYITYSSVGGKWQPADHVYSLDAKYSYDYYYGVTAYRSDSLLLTPEKRSASLAEATGMTDKAMGAFTWTTGGDDVITMDEGQIGATDTGWSVVIGYKQDPANHTYEYIGVPVRSTVSGFGGDMQFGFEGYTKISSAEDLIALANNPEGWKKGNKYVLTNDIDLGGMEWSPIGYSLVMGTEGVSTKYTKMPLDGESATGATVPFSGIFDGNGHTIRNFKITKAVSPVAAQALKKAYDEKYDEDPSASLDTTVTISCVGLFGYIHNGTVTGLNVEDAEISINVNEENPGVTFKDGKKMTLPNQMRLYAGLLAGAIETNDFWSILEDSEKSTLFLQSLLGSEDPVELNWDTLIEDMEKAFDPPASYRLLLTPRYALEFHQEDVLKTAESNHETLSDAQVLEKCMELAKEYYMLTLIFYHVQQETKKAPKEPVRDCSVNGSVYVNGDERICYAGLLAGSSSADASNCNAAGTVNNYTMNGAAGGMFGQNYIVPQRRLENLDVQADVAASRTNQYACAGGLSGEFNISGAWDMSIFDLPTREMEDDDEGYLTLVNAAGGGAMVMLLLKYITEFNMEFFEDPESEDGPGTANAVVANNSFVGKVKAAYGAGGLIGIKKTDGEAQVDTILWRGTYDLKNLNSSDMNMYLYNVDLFGNYVNADMTNNNYSAWYQGGLIGYTDMKNRNAICKKTGDTQTDILSDDVTFGEFSYGHIRDNVCFGIFGNEHEHDTVPFQYAGDLVGGIMKYDYMKAEDNISRFTIHDVLYTGELEGKTRGFRITEGDKTTTIPGYQEIGGHGHGLAEGEQIPDKPNKTRIDFRTSMAKTEFYEGDTFEPLSQAYDCSNGKVKLITAGFSSSQPDMTKIGTQTVTVQYKDASDRYEIHVYPRPGYLKFTKSPTVSVDGKSLSGGVLSLYKDKQEIVGNIPLSACKVEKNENGIFIVTYDNKYTIAVRPVRIDAYRNDLVTDDASLLKTRFYTQGTKAVTKEIVPEVIEEAKDSYKCVFTSCDKEFTAVEDTSILSYYQKQDKKGSPSDKDALPAIGTLLLSKDTKGWYRVTGYQDAADGKTDLVVEFAKVGPKLKKKAKISVPSKVLLEGDYNGVVTGLGAKALKGNKKLKTLVLSAGITQIGKSACEKCKKLQTVTFKGKVKKVGKGAFAKCGKLKALNFKYSIAPKGVSKGAFKKVPGSVKVGYFKKLKKKQVNQLKKALKKGGLPKKAKFVKKKKI